MVKITKNKDLDNQLIVITVKEYKYLLKCKKTLEKIYKIAFEKLLKKKVERVEK